VPTTGPQKVFPPPGVRAQVTQQLEIFLVIEKFRGGSGLMGAQKVADFG
jgi:hypothetical protein